MTSERYTPFGMLSAMPMQTLASAQTCNLVRCVTGQRLLAKCAMLFTWAPPQVHACACASAGYPQPIMAPVRWPSFLDDVRAFAERDLCARGLTAASASLRGGRAYIGYCSYLQMTMREAEKDWSRTDGAEPPESRADPERAVDDR